jgi:hypothetical protein
MDYLPIQSGEQSDFSKIKIAVITPHQDYRRKRFLERLKYYVLRQTKKPNAFIIVDEKTNLAKDLTLRIKIGIDIAFESGCQVALIMEDDDWYHPTYIENTFKGWIEAGKPDLYGQGYTDYYNIISQKYTRLHHPKRASLMSTLINLQKIYNFKWPPDNKVFLDMDLWKQLKGKTYIPAKPIAVGIKHGIGNTGGSGHIENWYHYSNKDQNFSYLKSLIGEDVNFYRNFF